MAAIGLNLVEMLLQRNQLSSIIQDEAGNIYAGTKSIKQSTTKVQVFGSGMELAGLSSVEKMLNQRLFYFNNRDDLNNIYAAGSTVTGGGGVWKWKWGGMKVATKAH